MAHAFALKTDISFRAAPRRISTYSPVPAKELSLAEVVRYGFPRSNIPTVVRRWKARNILHLLRGAWRSLLAQKLGIAHLYGQWCFAIIDPQGRRIDYGLASLRVITVSGAGHVADAFQGLASLSSFRFHGIGGSGTPETANDSALLDEFGGEYIQPNTRPEGTQVEGVSPNIYRTVAFIEVTDTVTIAEAGLFSQSSVISGSPAGGTLLDRLAVASETVFAGFTLVSDVRVTVATGT
jgi:hypothetical protein